jgi:hypothetical protein
MTHLDTISIIGTIEVTEIDTRTGVIRSRETVRNKVHTAARQACMAALDGGAGALTVTHVALSTDDTAPAVGDTTLAGEVLRLAYDTKTSPSGASRQYKLVLGASQGNGNTFRKVALFTAGSGGTMVASGLLASPKVKTDAKILVITYTLSVGQE